MKSATRSPAIKRAQERACRAGYRVTFREFVADAQTPALFPGQIAGRCDYERREIVVSTHRAPGVPRTRPEIAAILNHECEHAEGADRGTDYPEFNLKCGGTTQ